MTAPLSIRTANASHRLRQLEALAEFRYQIRRFLHFSEEVAAEAGLRAQQYQLLQVVAATAKSDPPTIAHVAERMLLRHNSAVELIDRTEQQGLLRRVQDKYDHRRMRLKLSSRGERVLARLVGKHLTELERVGPEIRRTLESAICEVGEAPGRTIKTTGRGAAKPPAKPVPKKAASAKPRSKATQL